MKNAAQLPKARTDNLVIRELDDETLVYDMERDEAHCLNRTAALVWKECNGQTTATEAARALKKDWVCPLIQISCGWQLSSFSDFTWLTSQENRRPFRVGIWF